MRVADAAADEQREHHFTFAARGGLEWLRGELDVAGKRVVVTSHLYVDGVAPAAPDAGSPDASPPAVDPAGDEGGCGCRTGAGGASGAFAALLAALLIARPGRPDDGYHRRIAGVLPRPGTALGRRRDPEDPPRPGAQPVALIVSLMWIPALASVVARLALREALDGSPVVRFLKLLGTHLTVGAAIGAVWAAGEELGWRGYLVQRLVDARHRAGVHAVDPGRGDVAGGGGDPHRGGERRDGRGAAHPQGGARGRAARGLAPADGSRS